MGNKGSTVSQENSGPPDADKNHPDNKPLTAEEFTDLSEMKRGCTDCLCLVGSMKELGTHHINNDV